MMHCSLVPAMVIAALTAVAANQHCMGQDRPVLRVAYFIPTDRKPEPDRVARLDRVLTEVQRFYREGMKANGFGPITFELERDAKGSLRIYDVPAKGSMRDYGRNSHGKVAEEVKAALARNGVDMGRETVIIFQLLLDWQDGRAIEIGAYVGGGTAHAGTAWVYDDAKLDPKLLGSKEPGGFYGGPVSIGRFNTHYIGGVAHELGHALTLPHERERDRDRPRRGNSLMGAGNHTYGQELRGEGPGSFLTPASALALSVHPLFTGKKLPSVPLTCRLAKINAKAEKGRINLTGQLVGGVKSVGLIAYADPRDTPGDYDAHGWPCSVDSEGRFQVALEDLRPVEYDLHLRALAQSGDTKYFNLSFRVNRDGIADVSGIQELAVLAEAHAALAARDAKRLEQILAEAKSMSPGLTKKIEHLGRLLNPGKPIDPVTIKADAREVRLSDLRLEHETTGWGAALRNQVLPEGDGSVLLQVGGEFFDSGLYAHAPARHVVKTAGAWKTLSTKYGLQDGHAGSVVFVVKGDGKELFRSRTVRDHKAQTALVNIAGIQVLELLVEDAGDGGTNDWGVWLDPRLTR